jgi:hypothetical protein
MKSSEKPDADLVRKLKYEERYPMKNRKLIKPSAAVAAALIATLSLSVVAFGGPAWRYLQTRVVEGEQYITGLVMMESEDGTIVAGSIETIQEGDGRIVVEVEGELQVWQDPLTLDDLDEALALFRGDETPMLPSYLPEGFSFQSARYNICPINNPEAGGRQLFITYGDGTQDFTIEIRYHPEEWGFDAWGSGLEEITINGHKALIGSGALSVQASSGIRHHFMTWPMLGSGEQGSGIGYDELVRMAESLR